jgi:hypothetical protein
MPVVDDHVEIDEHGAPHGRYVLERLMAILEAMSYGMPVVATPVVASRM